MGGIQEQERAALLRAIASLIHCVVVQHEQLRQLGAPVSAGGEAEESHDKAFLEYVVNDGYHNIIEGFEGIELAEKAEAEVKAHLSEWAE